MQFIFNKPVNSGRWLAALHGAAHYWFAYYAAT